MFMFNLNIFKRLFKSEPNVEIEEQPISNQSIESATEITCSEPLRENNAEFVSAEIIFDELDSQPKIKQIKKQRTYRSESKYR